MSAVRIQLLELAQFVHVPVRVADAEATINQEADVLALLDAELRRAAVGVDLPLLVAEADVDLIDARDPRDEAVRRQPALDELPRGRIERAQVFDEQQLLALGAADT